MSIYHHYDAVISTQGVILDKRGNLHKSPWNWELRSFQQFLSRFLDALAPELPHSLDKLRTTFRSARVLACVSYPGIPIRGYNADGFIEDLRDEGLLTHDFKLTPRAIAIRDELCALEIMQM